MAPNPLRRAAPRGPLLAPGVPVVRRDDRHLQVGIDPPHRVVVADEPDVHRLLADLRSGTPPTPATAAGRRALDGLAGSGLLLDLDQVVEQRARRAAARVWLDGPRDRAPRVLRLLRAVDLAPAARAEEATVVLVVRDGLVPRGALDDLVRDGVPHLVVGGDHRGVTLGPFVRPGQTACLRCVDAHLGLHDPRRPLLVEQAAAAPAPPLDPVLEQVALAWAVGDVLTWCEGGAPSTWSATVGLCLGLEPTVRRWARHPGCGCAWGDALTG